METHKITGLLAALAERDKEIEILKLSLQAHTVRTSNVQARLLRTLDTLDTIQTANIEDLEAERRSYRKLKEKLHQYQGIVQECESERDDTRDAVNALVEKVETSNNYALWSHARMRISAHVDPIITPTSLALGINNADSTVLEYAAAVIQALTLERDLEKRAHQQDLQMSQAKIAMLEAQLGFRESELESCVAHTQECFDPRIKQELETELTRMSREDTLNLLQLAAAKNKILDTGNKHLLKRLEIFRFPTASKADASCQTVGQEPIVEAEKESEAAASPATTGGDMSTFGVISKAKASPFQARRTSSLIENFDREIRELGSKVDAFRAEKMKLIEIIQAEKPNRSKSVHSLNSSDYNPRKEESYSSENHPLSRTSFSPKFDRPNEPTAIFDDANVATRELLEKAYEASLQREKSLLEQNANLLHLLHQLQSDKVTATEPIDQVQGSVRTTVAIQSPHAHATNNSESPQRSQMVQLLDDGGEMTMDLGTPLLPTVIVLPTASQSSTSSSPRPAYSPQSRRSSPSEGHRAVHSKPGDLIEIEPEWFSQESAPLTPVTSCSPLPLSPPDSGYPEFSNASALNQLTHDGRSIDVLTGPEPVTEADVQQLEDELAEAQKRLAQGEKRMNDVQEALFNLGELL